MSKFVDLETIVTEDLKEIEDVLIQENHISAYEEYDTFKLLIVNKILTTEDSLHFYPEVLILRNGEVYFYKRSDDLFKKLPQGVKSLCLFLDKLYLNNQKVLAAYSDEIESLEGRLYTRDIQRSFMETWFKLKKDLARIENYYYRQSIVLKEFLSSNESQRQAHAEEFKDIEDSIAFQNSNITTLKSRLDGVHHYHDAINKDKDSRAFFVLTVISSIFLPLNLIVGFFGMNTGTLYLTQPGGTDEVLVLLLTILLVILVGQRLLKITDHYFLRYLFGRYNLYKNITHNLSKIDEKLKGR